MKRMTDARPEARRAGHNSVATVTGHGRNQPVAYNLEMTRSTRFILSAALTASLILNIVQFTARQRRKNRRTMKLDKYARDGRAWRDFAKVAYTGAVHLFGSANLFLVFPAATLAHHALEMYLKAALIAEGV